MYKGTFSRFARYGLGESFTRSNFRLFSSTPAKYKKAFSPVEDFFAKHPSFAHDATAQISKEFKALCSHYGWTKKHFKKENTTEQGKRAQLVKHEYQEALISEFGENYGKDPESLWGWKELCEAVRIKPIPDTVTECRKAVRRVHVNLVDLLDYKRMGNEAQIFPNVIKLRKYTKRNDKFFPKWQAKAHGPLKYLLRGIR